jgi:minichromosome maintenance protein 10
MDSSSSRQEEEQGRQAEIRKQIALLQAQLVDNYSQGTSPLPPLSSPKRKQRDETCLAPATPSPSEPYIHE